MSSTVLGGAACDACVVPGITERFVGSVSVQ